MTAVFSDRVGFTVGKLKEAGVFHLCPDIDNAEMLFPSLSDTVVRVKARLISFQITSKSLKFLLHERADFYLR
jgi:hypothetical protein